MKNTIILILFLLFLSSCKDEPLTPKPEVKLLLSVEDVSCTEAWVKLTTTNLQLPTSLNLFKDDNIFKTINLQTADTLLNIDSLLPNQTYIIQAFTHSNNQSHITSNELSVTTMDTTSHNFTFETFEFGGEAGSCELTDVVIIDENNIWCVGYITIADTSENGFTTYGAIHWNGQMWELKKLVHSTNIPVTPRGIFIQNQNEFYLAAGSIFKWDGVSSTVQLVYSRLNLPNPSGTIEKLWGSSGSSIYGVGNAGSIIHYDGSQWSRIESGTATNINDVWGVVNPITQEQNIYCAVSFVFQAGDKKILTIKNNIVDSLSWNVGRRIHSVWSKSGLFVYAAGGGVHENKRGYWNEITQVPLYYSRNIRGTDYNNIFVCGDFGLFSHFNGVEWKTFDELSIQGVYLSIAAKNNIVVAVGFQGSKAIIVKGIRN